MKIQTINVQNFRKLLQCRIDDSEKTTIVHFLSHKGDSG